MELDMVADIDIDIDINIDMEIQFGERVGHGGLVNWVQTYSTQSLPGLHISSSKLSKFILWSSSFSNL